MHPDELEQRRSAFRVAAVSGLITLLSAYPFAAYVISGASGNAVADMFHYLARFALGTAGACLGYIGLVSAVFMHKQTRTVAICFLPIFCTMLWAWWDFIGF